LSAGIAKLLHLFKKIAWSILVFQHFETRDQVEASAILLAPICKRFERHRLNPIETMFRAGNGNALFIEVYSIGLVADIGKSTQHCAVTAANVKSGTVLCGQRAE
jgi:hypothetical protein